MNYELAALSPQHFAEVRAIRQVIDGKVREPEDIADRYANTALRIVGARHL